MFPTRYFADRFYAPRYFPKVGASSAGVGFRSLLAFWLGGAGVPATISGTLFRVGFLGTRRGSRSSQ